MCFTEPNFAETDPLIQFLIRLKRDMLSRKSLKITRDEPRKRVNFTGTVNRFVFRPDCLLEEIK